MLSERTTPDSERRAPGVTSDSRIELATWQMARTSAGSVTHPRDLDVANDSWTFASAPGTVAGALQAAAQWDWSAPVEIDDYDWWYRCQFSCEDVEAGASIEFGGLASLAEVWLNGTQILSSNNMFVAHQIDAGEALASDNELVIRFASLTAALTTRRPRPRWRTRLVNNQNLRWIRTTLLGRMPGWSSAPQPVGPWKSVAVHPGRDTRIVSAKVQSRLDGQDGIVSISLRVHAAAGTDFTAATASVGATEHEATIHGQDGDFVIHSTIRITDAKLWWPHTHGDQPLYDVAVRLVSDGGDTLLAVGRAAFRTLRLNTGEGDFGLHINDERIFWRGTCWSPAEPLQLHSATAEYRRTLTLARDAGINMIRIGGTMVYEHDDFYDLCDELGIAVWQDFMFANMDYPCDDSAFASSVAREATQLLDRIGDRPSLAIVCGNSEVEQQAAMLGLPSSEWRNLLFSKTLPDLVAEHAGSVPYWPSSPSGGVLPFHVNAGDGHYFGYGPYLRPFSDVRASQVRFASETLAFSNVPEPLFVDEMPCGVAGAGHHPAWKAGIPRDNGSGWDFEDVRDHYVHEMFDVDPVRIRYSDPERYLALGRVAAGEVMQRTIAEWRRADSSCSGALVWLYRDLRPGAGWGMLDYNGKPKSAYYYLARAYRPMTVLIADEGLNGIVLHAINDGPAAVTPELRLALFRETVPVGNASVRLNLAERSASAISAEELIGTFTDISYAYRFGRPNHDALVATLIDPDTGIQLAQSFHFPLGIGAPRPSATLMAAASRIDDGSYALRISTDALALAVAIEVKGWQPSDNYFHVAPNSERTILLTASGTRAKLSGSVTALNAASVGFYAA